MRNISCIIKKTVKIHSVSSKINDCQRPYIKGCNILNPELQWQLKPLQGEEGAFNQEIGLRFEEQRIILNRCNGSIALCGADNLPLRKDILSGLCYSLRVTAH
jgi:hypothetical protein